MIKPIAIEDQESLVKLALQDIGGMYEPLMRRELEDIIADKNFGVCSLREGEIVGYAVASKTVDTYHLLTIAVDKKYREEGVGAEVLDGIFAEVEKRGGKILNVVTDADAQETLRFYLKNGFAFAGIVQDEFLPGVAQAHLTRRMGYKP